MEIKHLLIIPDRTDMKNSLQLAKEYGCGFEYQDFFTPKVLEDEQEIRERLEVFAQNPPAQEYCTFHGAFFDVLIFSDDPGIVQVSDKRVEQSLQLATKLGAKGVVFHTNYTPNFNMEFYHKNWLDRNGQYWREKLRAYPNLQIYMENMFDTNWQLLARLGEMMKDEERFGICFDYAHAHVFGKEEELEEWVKHLAPYVKHMHINDNDFQRDLHLAVGKGKIDWARFKYNYETYMQDASVLVEVSGNERIKQSLEFLAKL